MEDSTGLLAVMPAELLEHIFKQCDGQTLLTALKVCKRWKDIVMHTKKNKQPLWYYVCHEELSVHSIETVKEYIKQSCFEVIDDDYWFTVYRLATIWKPTNDSSTNHSITSRTPANSPKITCASALGQYVATGHANGELNMWHVSTGHVMRWESGTYQTSSLFAISSIHLVLNDFPKKIPEPNRKGPIFREYKPESREPTNHSDQRKLYGDLKSYHVFYLCDGSIYRTAFSESAHIIGSIFVRDVTRVYIKHDLMVCWTKRPMRPITMYDISETEVKLKPHTYINLSVVFSSVGLWEPKVKVVTMDCQIMEFDLSKGRHAQWEFRQDESDKLRPDCVYPSFQYPGDVILGITNRGDIWIESEHQANLVPKNISLNNYFPTYILLHGNLLAVGTSIGSVYLFYVESNLLDWKSYKRRSVIQVSAGYPVKFLAIVDGANPILAAATEHGLCFVYFHDFC